MNCAASACSLVFCFVNTFNITAAPAASAVPSTAPAPPTHPTGMNLDQ